MKRLHIRVESISHLVVAGAMLFCVAGVCGEIPLTLTEPSGVVRRADVVTSGVPFPRGVLKEGQPVQLLDNAGKPATADVRVTARWRDGSVMWLLLDFQADLNPGETKTFRLTYGPNAKVASPATASKGIVVNENASTISVDTGALSARIGKTSFSLPEAITLRGGAAALRSPGQMFLDLEHTPPGQPNEEDWLRKSAASPDSKPDRFTAAASKKPFTAAVEWKGAMRTVVRLDGWLADPEGREEFPYTVRLTFHAGKPWVWMTHTFVFTGDVKKDFLRRLAVQQQFALAGKPQILFGGAKPVQAPADATWASMLETGPSVLRHKVPYTDVKPVAYQVDAGKFVMDAKPVESGTWAKGWATLQDGTRGVTFAVRQFDKLFPKEVTVDAAAGTITQYLWPDRGNQVLDLRRRYDYVENEIHYDLGMWPKGGRGLAKTHEMLLWFHEGALNPQTIDATVSAFNQRLFAVAPPEWYGNSDFMPRFQPRDPQRFPRFEAFMDTAMEWRLRNVSQFGWYGWIDFGDTLFSGYEEPSHSGDGAPKSWCSRGYRGWLCNDGAEDRNILLHFLRSGDRRLFDHWEAMVRHVTDIDAVHYDEEPANVGGGHRHDEQHWGNYLSGYGTASFGAMDMYLLTGDLRCLDVFKEYANFHRKGGGSEDEYVGESLTRLASVTGDNALWEEAKQTVRSSYYGFQMGDSGKLDHPHFRCSTIQHPSLLTYLTYSDDAEMRDYWVTAARKRVQSLDLGLGSLQFGYAYRYSKDTTFLDGLKLHYSMWGPYVFPRLQEFYPDKVFKKPLREMDFEELAALTKRCTNNIYGQYEGPGVFPYLLSIAAETGKTESDLLDSPPRLKNGGEAWDWGWTGAQVKGADRAKIAAVDLRAAANSNPWNELRCYGQPLTGDPPVAGKSLHFDFLNWGEVEPGCYPVRAPSVYPVVLRSDFTVREEGSYVYGLPWGGRMEFSGVPFDLLHPSANNGKSVIVLHDKETVSLPVKAQGKRLFLLGMIADNAPFDREVGAELTLHYADGKNEKQPLRNLDAYENWHFWGFSKKASLVRAFKVSSQWDGRTTLLNLLEVPLQATQLDSVELTDTGKGHRLVVLAASLESDSPQTANAKTIQCDLVNNTPEGEGWLEAKQYVTPSGTLVTLSGPATYHVKVPAGSYRVDLEASGSGNGLAEVVVNGQPAAAPWTLSSRTLSPDGTQFERVALWGRADDKGLDITIQTAPGKGLWRHQVVYARALTLRYLAVTPEDQPAFSPLPSAHVTFGWGELPTDPFTSGTRHFEWKGDFTGAENTMIVGTGRSEFKVALPPGAYQVTLVAPSLLASTPLIGQVNPGPARITLQDGKSYTIPQPDTGKSSHLDLQTTVGNEGLTLAIEPAEGAKNWGLASVEIRK